MKKKTGMSTLSEAQRKEIIEVASLAAIEQYHKEAEKTRKAARDKRLHNTELLMKKYRGFLIHSMSAVCEASQIEDDLDLESLLDIMDCGGKDKSLSVVSIQESAARTRVIIHHINRMLECYKHLCEKSAKQEEMRRYRVICGLYIDDEEKSPQDLADQEHVDLVTIYRDKKAALQQLSALIFGYFE